MFEQAQRLLFKLANKSVNTFLQTVITILLNIDFFLYVSVSVFCNTFFDTILCVTLSSVSFPALLTFRWKSTGTATNASTSEAGDDNNKIRSILENDTMHKEFFNFTVKEFTTENVLFYDSVREMKLERQKLMGINNSNASNTSDTAPYYTTNTGGEPVVATTPALSPTGTDAPTTTAMDGPSLTARVSDYDKQFLKKAQYLYADFIDPKGPFALNITQVHIARFKGALLEQSVEQVQQAFDFVVEKIVANMMDTYSRFSKLQVYKTWLEQQQIEMSAKAKLGW